MNVAFTIAGPLLPKQVKDLLDSQNQLKAFETELEYAKRHFQRFELLSENIRKFATTWEMKLCSLDENAFFLREWDRQLKKFEVQADASVFNTALDVGIRTLNAKKFRKRLASFKAEVQSTQLNAILDLLSMVMQLSTAALISNPMDIISTIREEFLNPCMTTQVAKQGGVLGYLPKDWVAAGSAVKTAASSTYSKVKGEPQDVRYYPESYQEQYAEQTPLAARSFLSSSMSQSLNDLIR